MRTRYPQKYKDPNQQVYEPLAETLETRCPSERKVYIRNPGEEVTVSKQMVKIRRFPIFWGLPMDEVCFSHWLANFLTLGIMPWDDIGTVHSTYLPQARNTIHDAFLASDSIWLLMLDSDVLPPPGFLDKLLAHKLMMVGGWYKKKSTDLYPVVYDYTGMGEDGKMDWHMRQAVGQGLEEVDGAGAGCWLMHKNVARAIGPSPYDMVHGGEDLKLCMKVREAGYKIYIDWDLACAHAGVGLY